MYYTEMKNTKTSLTKFLSYDSNHENRFHMPNDVFEKLRKCEEIFRNNRSSHIAFAYGYYYLISWFYRYAKYGIIPFETPLKKLFKKLLAKSETATTFNYIVKKNGVLNKLGFTRPEKDAPLKVDFDDILKIPEWSYESKIEITTLNRKNNLIDFPIRGFYSFEESEKENVVDGTFFDSANTHNVPFDAYLECITDSILGVEGFYLYGFLCYKTDQFKFGFHSPITDLAGATGLNVTKMKELLKRLEEKGMVMITHKPFVLGLNDGEKVEANTYKAIRQGWEEQDLSKPKRKNHVMSRDTYVDRGYVFIGQTHESLDEDPFAS